MGCYSDYVRKIKAANTGAQIVDAIWELGPCIIKTITDAGVDVTVTLGPSRQRLTGAQVGQLSGSQIRSLLQFNEDDERRAIAIGQKIKEGFQDRRNPLDEEVAQSIDDITELVMRNIARIPR